ncbi:hypothetical protein KUTeg_008704 [Tegillarca granosa]|uniref:MULE transposase domain-containing protein n=1 Tax=Tegillarca granosa TaxID=220873 RepID=A0ABQ9FEQ0_TEGGR|nr:hypothetical protein KUTeg_008704 [Tegillarca granosa]
MGSLVNTDTTEADTQEAHSTEAHFTEANAPHNNSSFEIENIPYQEPTIIQKNVRNKSGKCPASVQQHGNEFSSGRHTQNHTARPGVATAVEIIKKVKSESSSNVFESASSIVERVVSTNTTTSDPQGSRPVLANLVRTANRVHERLRPKEPEDLTFQIAPNYIPDGFLRADVKVGDERHLIFATEDQLQLSGEECKMIPLVFCLMSRRRQKDYIKILQSITGMLQQQELKCVVVDFEIAMWGAVKKVMPGVKIKGCIFHMTQAIWRKTQELRLQVKIDGTAEHLVPAFDKLKEKPLLGPITELLSYTENTWIHNNTYQVKSWCMYRQPIRTNNDVEGWHRRLNKKAGEDQTPFYVLIPLLHTETKMVPLQAKLVSEKKLKRYQRQSTRYVQSQLFLLWENYRNGELTISQLLRQSSKLNGPTQEK